MAVTGRLEWRNPNVTVPNWQRQQWGNHVSPSPCENHHWELIVTIHALKTCDAFLLSISLSDASVGRLYRSGISPLVVISGRPMALPAGTASSPCSKQQHPGCVYSCTGSNPALGRPGFSRSLKQSCLWLCSKRGSVCKLFSPRALVSKKKGHPNNLENLPWIQRCGMFRRS